MKHLMIVCIVVMAYGANGARWTAKPRRTTTTVAPSTVAPSPATLVDKSEVASLEAVPPTVETPVEDKKYHPAEVQKPRVIERSDERHFDGHYEYRYVLSNGDTRYERSYWQQVGDKKMLVRKGYYSYPMPNKKYMTVFYTADENGFHQDSATYSQSQPVLPRSLDAPDSVDAPVVTKKPIVSPVSGNKAPRPTRPKRPVVQKKNADDVAVTELPDDTTESIVETETMV